VFLKGGFISTKELHRLIHVYTFLNKLWRDANMNKYKYVTPKCCERAQKEKAVYLRVKDGYYGNNINRDSPVEWVTSGWADELNCQQEVPANFCPFCGTKVPRIVKRKDPPEKVITVSDGGYYCDTCKKRLNVCECECIEALWEPKC
jgi:hypothetical protein